MIVPLEPGDNPEAISHNIREMIGSGHPQPQAVAAALHNAKDAARDDWKNSRFTVKKSGKVIRQGISFSEVAQLLEISEDVLDSSLIRKGKAWNEDLVATEDAQAFGKRDAKRLLEEHAVGGEGLKRYAKGAGISVSAAIKELQSIAGTWDALASVAVAYRASGAHATDHNGYSLYTSSVGVDAWRGDQYIGTFCDEATAKKSLDAQEKNVTENKATSRQISEEEAKKLGRLAWFVRGSGGKIIWYTNATKDASSLGDSLARISDAVKEPKSPMPPKIEDAKSPRDMTEQELQKAYEQEFNRQMERTDDVQEARRRAKKKLGIKTEDASTLGDALAQMRDAIKE